jgi:iron complex transport system substrate-binding protein
MKKRVTLSLSLYIYGIIAAVVVAAGVGIAFAAMSMNGDVAVNQQPRSSDSDVIRIIKHAMGETEIAGMPARIVVVDGELTENLLTLNAHSSIVGASLWEIFGTSFEQEMREINLDVPSNVVDTGDYWAPNLEVITQLEPDVIITSDAWNRQNYGAFSKIAPTLMFSTHPTEDDSTTTLQEMEENFMVLANLVGKQREGARVLEGLDAKLDDAAANVESAGLKGRKFLLAEMWVDNGSLTMFLYTKNSVASQILERVGLQNALTSDENAP